MMLKEVVSAIYTGFNDIVLAEKMLKYTKLVVGLDVLIVLIALTISLHEHCLVYDGISSYLMLVFVVNGSYVLCYMGLVKNLFWSPLGLIGAKLISIVVSVLLYGQPLGLWAFIVIFFCIGSYRALDYKTRTNNNL